MQPRANAPRWAIPGSCQTRATYRPLPRGAGSPAGCSLQLPSRDPAPSPANAAPRDVSAASRSPQALPPGQGSALGLPQNAGMAQGYQYKCVLPVKATTCNSRVTLNETVTACQYKLNRFCNGLGIRHSFCKCANEARTSVAAAYLSCFFLLLQHEAKWGQPGCPSLCLVSGCARGHSSI